MLCLVSELLHQVAPLLYSTTYLLEKGLKSKVHLLSNNYNSRRDVLLLKNKTVIMYVLMSLSVSLRIKVS